MSAFTPRFLSLVFLLIAGSPWAAMTVTPPAPDNPAAQAQLAESYGKLPLSFEENEGQTSDKVKFFSRGPGYSLFLTPDEAVLALRKPEPRSTRHAHEPPPVRMAHATPKTQEGAVLRMRLAGAREPARILGRDRQPGTVNYLKGRDPGQWRTGLATYGKVEYQGVYPGVDLVYYGNQRQLEYDFIVAPGADPNRIRLSFAGDGGQTVAPRLDGNGDLLLPTEAGEVRLHKPVVYQNIDGQRREIDGRFLVFPEEKYERQVGFQVAEYDRARPLVIDPVLVYSTYLGGSGDDRSQDIAVDSAGNAYVVGTTYSSDFPTANAEYPQLWGGTDVFVTKLSADGQHVIYSTYIGGSNSSHINGEDCGNNIAVDSNGNVYITGGTNSVDFPTVNAKYLQLRGGQDAFVTKLSSNGQQVIYSTYLGGSLYEEGNGIAVDNVGNAYVVGWTVSVDFPAINAKYAQHHGGQDIFVAKLSPSGQQVIYSTYLGGGGNDGSEDIAIDSAGNVYITGATWSTNFPIANAKYPQGGGGLDAFALKLSSDGQTVLYSTYLGGGDYDYGTGIAVDRTGNAYITGWTTSSNFPTANAKYPQLRGGGDAFVLKLSNDGKTVYYSTYFGGYDSDSGHDIAVDSAGNSYVTGWTGSMDLPIMSAKYPQLRGRIDAFVFKLSNDGQALRYSTYIGGSSNEARYIAIAVDSVGNAYVTGDTDSTDFPTSATDPNIVSYDSTHNGGSDAFVAKLANYALTVTKSGTGQGTVTSSPAAINCGTACTKTYAQPTSVTLTATPAADSRFVRWEGSCAGTASTCILAVNEGKRVTAVFNSTLPLDAKPLIDKLKLLKSRALLKIDSDVDRTAQAFFDSWNIRRSLVWSDWAGTILDVIGTTLDSVSLLGSLADPVKLNTDLVTAFKAGGSIAEISGLFLSVNSLVTDSSETLRLAMNGPDYENNVKAMLTAARNTACTDLACITYSESAYKSIVKSQMAAKSNNLLVITHRSSDTRRRNFEAVGGYATVKGRIGAKLQSTIDALTVRGTVPAGFPMLETLKVLDDLKTAITLSSAQETQAIYDSLLGDGQTYLKHREKVLLGRIANLERFRGQALGDFAANVKYQQIDTIKTAASSIAGVYSLSGLRTLKLPSGAEMILNTHAIVNTSISASLSVKKSFVTTARQQIDELPQTMLNALPEELSDLWMIADDIGSRIARQAKLSP
jgi:hypothetical protein